MAATQDVLDTPEAGSAALRGGALRTAGYFAGVLLSLGSAPLLIRHLGVVDFGRYVTVVSLMVLVTGVTEGGLNAIGLREYATSSGEARRATLATLLGIRWVVSLIGVALGVAFAVLAGYDRPLVLGAVGAGIGVVGQAVQLLISVPLQGELRFGWVTALEFARQVLSVGAIVALVLAGAGLVPFLWVAAPVSLLLLGVTARLVRGTMPLRPTLRPGGWWPLLRDTLPYTVAVAVNVVYFRVTILVLSLRADDLQTGYFATPFRVVEVLLNLPLLIIGAAYPILARAVRDDEARFSAAMGRILELATVFGAWMSLNLVVGAPVAIAVLAGGDADPSIGVLRVQGLTLTATGIAVAASYGLLSRRRHAPLLVANATALVVAIVGTLSLVPSLGARGAALATLLAETTVAISLLAVLLREHPELRRGAWGMVLVLGAAAAGLAAGLLCGLPALAAVVLANLVFALALLATGRFPPEVRQVLAPGAA